MNNLNWPVYNKINNELVSLEDVQKLRKYNKEDSVALCSSYTQTKAGISIVCPERGSCQSCIMETMNEDKLLNLIKKDNIRKLKEIDNG